MADAVSWRDAVAELRRFLPAPTDFSTPDLLSAAADAVAGPASWQSLPGWEDLPDLEILDRLLDDLSPLTGTVLVVTDPMFSRGDTPVRIPAERLREFVSGYLASVGCCFFDGDVVILAPEVGRLGLFHHEGIFAHWQLGGSGVRPS
jgi:hypothetical protein